MDQEQNPEQQTETATAEPGSLDAAALAFQKREEAAEQTAEGTQDSTEEAEQTTDAEAQEGETEDEEAPNLEEVEIEGVKLRLTKEEAEALHKSTLRQAEFSRKMNDLSAKEKRAQETIEQAELLRTGAEKFAEALASIKAMDAQIKQYEALNWQQLRTDDPAQYAAYAADLQTLKLNRAQAEQGARQISSQVQNESSKALQTKRAEMFDTLKKSIPGWSDQRGQEITEYAVSLGMSFETLAKTTDAAVVVALDKARRYDELHKQKSELKAKAKTAAPVAKPGAVKAKPSQLDEAMTQLRKFKTRDAAEVAFLARMK